MGTRHLPPQGALAHRHGLLCAAYCVQMRMYCLNVDIRFKRHHCDKGETDVPGPKMNSPPSWVMLPCLPR